MNNLLIHPLMQCIDFHLLTTIIGILFLFTLVQFFRMSKITKKNKNFYALANNIFENIAVALVIISSDYKILYINSVAIKMFNKEGADNLIGTPWDFLNAPSIEPIYEKISSALIDKQDFERGYQYFSTQGSRFLHCFFKVLSMPTGEDLFFLSFFDKTEQDEFRQKFIQQLEETQRTILSKDNFFSNMSHELRTPINAIIGLTFIAKKQKDSSKILEYISKIEESTEQLLTVVNDILDYSKIKEAGFELLHEKFNLVDIKDVLNDVFKVIAIKKQINLVISFNCPNPFWVHGDQFRLTQIFMNLISNAIKFTEKGSVTVTLNYETVKNDIILRCSVRDSGTGISEENLESLFSDYEQFGNVLEKRYEGTGLGLAITRRLVELMNGVIWAESHIDQGAFKRIFVFLPQDAESHIDQGALFHFIVMLKKIDPLGLLSR